LSRGHIKKAQTDLLKDTLDLLVLKALQARPAHGWDKLTAAGWKQLSAETETWRLFTGTVELILKTS
jgi:hypothetical protein